MMMLKMMVMTMMMMTQTCRSLRTSMSLTGRQTAVLQNITCVFCEIIAMIKKITLAILVVMVGSEDDNYDGIEKDCLTIHRVGSCVNHDNDDDDDEDNDDDDYNSDGKENYLVISRV